MLLSLFPLHARSHSLTVQLTSQQHSARRSMAARQCNAAVVGGTVRRLEVGGGEKPLQAAEQQLRISLPQISKDASKYQSLGIRMDLKTDIE